MMPGRWWYQWAFRASAWLRPWRRKRERREELGEHRQRLLEQNLAAGMAAAEAQRAADAALGGWEGLEAECADVAGFPRLREAVQDVRHALRILRHAPGFTAIAVLTLGLGVGANTAVFSVINGLLLRPLPVRDPARLGVLAFRQGDGPLLLPFSIADFRDIRAQTPSVFSGMAGYQFGFDGLSDPASAQGRADRVVSNYVSGNYFSLLGLKPQLGRLIETGEGASPGADPVVVLSDAYWRSRFAADRNVAGRKVRINGHILTVIGVAPKGFHGLYALIVPQVYLPLGMIGLEPYPQDFMENRILQNLMVVGSLRPGVSWAAAESELAEVGERLAAAYPATDRGLRLRVYPERQTRPDPDTSAMLWHAGKLFWVLVGLVLLLACANVGGLLTIRNAGRRRELAIRTALGARPGRLVRQLLTENLVLALLGGGVGLAIGMWASQAAAALSLHFSVISPLNFQLDGRVFAYVLAVTLAAGVLAGLPPALRARVHAPAMSAVGRATGSRRARAALVIAQVAISLTLLEAAVLFAQGLIHARRVPLGFDPLQVQTWTMDPLQIGANPEQGLQLYRQLLERVRALPQAASAALCSSLPLDANSNDDYLNVDRYARPPGQGMPLVAYSVVSSGYFETLRIPLVQGRGFRATDRAGAPPVAIVNRAFAARYWPGLNPIGQHFTKVSGITNPRYEVVGVARDSRTNNLGGPMAPYFYLPLEQNYLLSSTQTLAVRSPADPVALQREVETVIHKLAPTLPVFGVRSLAAELASPNGWLLYQFAAVLAAILAGVGLLLAGLGVYGVVAHSAALRRGEIAVRMALGAQPRDLLALLLRQGMAVITVGVMLGWLGAMAAARWSASLLTGLSAGGLATLAGVSAFLLAVAFAACYLPARQALAADPASVLRQE